MTKVSNMRIKLVAYGIAKDILSAGTKDYQVKPMATIGELKEQLIGEFSDFEKLRSLRFAVNEEYQPDDHQLSENDEVVIIPPVSGG